MLHHKPMRFVPLLSSSIDPAPWARHGSVVLRWEGLHPGWSTEVRRGLVLAAMVLPGREPLNEALEVLQARLDPDFLILPVGRFPNRAGGLRFLGLLESLLEATSGRAVKLALQLASGAEPQVLELLKQARAEAVGFCWHPGNLDPEPLADRLWFGICEAYSNLAPLQRLGYRWDMALPAQSPASFREEAAVLAAAHPPVLFPEVLPATALGRPVLPDAQVVLGAAWSSGSSRP